MTMVRLPQQLYCAAQTRELDRLAIEDHGIPGGTLMGRAGLVCFASLRAQWPEAHCIAVLCGGGNNGGDGYVIARLAANAGLAVEVITLSDPARLRGDAAKARAEYDGPLRPWDGVLPSAEVYVDAMLGTGLDRPVQGKYEQAIEAINQRSAPVLAVDIPSGLSADSGAILGCAIEATTTVTLIGLKRGLLTAAACDRVGTLVFDDLGVPAAIYEQVQAECSLADERVLRAWRPRRRDSHKGSYGSLLIVGGDRGMPGAVCLTATAALRSGAGLVRVATHADHADWLPLRQPELISQACRAGEDLADLLRAADTVAIGPGLGQSPWAGELLQVALRQAQALVVDADGLNLLAEHSWQRQQPWILTPHPAEAARLLGTDTATVQADRFAAARAIAQRYQAVCVLKGAGTIVADASRWALCPLGNPGMASAGMGDVLTGVIAALWAQRGDAFSAAVSAVVAHAGAGDMAAGRGQRGLLASDVIAQLPCMLNP